MSVLRTARQVEANKLDLDIYRAALMVERFAADFARISERESFEQMARDIRGRRHLIRQYMHPKDREATS
jgi:hypothetical protein